MHELSLAMDVISLVSDEAGKNHLGNISEIQIEVGSLSGVEADAFEWALELASKGTILENAGMKIVRTTGTGRCDTCNIEFEMKQILDTCPRCNEYPVGIRGGREFRVVSITGE